MALLWMDGFDHYGASGTDFDNTGGVGSYNPIPSGNGCEFATMPELGGLGLKLYYYASSSGGFGWQLPTAKTSGIFGFGFHAYSSQVGRRTLLCNAECTGSQIVGIGYVDSSPASFDLTDYNSGSSQSVLDSFTPSAMQSVLFHFEVQYDIDNQTVEVRVNGSPVLSATNLSFGNVTGLRFCRALDQGFWIIDNLYIYDETGTVNKDWLGERNVYTIFPDADTAQADWTLSTGTDGFDLLNDVPPDGENNYITSDTVGDQSNFSLEELANPNVKIAALMSFVNANKDNPGPAEIQWGVNASDTEDISTSTVVTQDQYLYFTKIHETNPSTDEGWEPSQIGDLEVFVKRSV